MNKKRPKQYVQLLNGKTKEVESMIVELENSLDNSLDNQIAIENENKMLKKKHWRFEKHHHKHHKRHHDQMLQSETDVNVGNKYDLPHNSGNLPNV